MRKEVNENTNTNTNEIAPKTKLIITASLAIIVLIIIAAIGIFAFGSCGIDYTETDTNTVYILKEGNIVSTDVEAFDEKKYSVAELENYLSEVMAVYNKGLEEPVLEQKNLTVEGNVAKLVLAYANADLYEKVNGVELFVGTIADAKKAGYTFEETFAKMKDGKAVEVSMKEFEKGEDYKVAIIKSNTKVVVQGKVCFVSSTNVAEVGEDYVAIKDGSLLIKEEVVEDTELDTEGADGSISEDEMADSDGDIIFDFGDVETETESQENTVLTYIIYK